MSTAERQILCIENDPSLLGTRCSVLTKSGYNVWAATSLEAEFLLRIQTFDLVILSATLSDSERVQLTKAAGAKARLLELPGFTEPATLLSEVAELLRSIDPPL
jgi:DNA-binding response OmpR family regulator